MLNRGIYTVYIKKLCLCVMRFPHIKPVFIEMCCVVIEVPFVDVRCLSSSPVGF